ncbi:hypothetical protein CH063_07648 [Colletotrichum higginsianum]|uniref:DUF3669 domain-containing protein n=1 Tax=Colletotrichum higginsianum (strain IMI 349063) TaxID=759273 RepID=H1V6X3_COLHI|nr:hypothetical protein CH063_07648 [Colletotrichum higginsianum]
MWPIDFNQCTLTQNNEAGIDRLVKAFIFNNPYYPQLNQSDDYDKGLWVVFCKPQAHPELQPGHIHRTFFPAK